MKTSISHRFEAGYAENAEILYTVEGSKCNLALQRFVWNDGNVNLVVFVLHDSIIFRDCINIQRQHRRIQSDSEDNDGVPVPTPSLGTPQNVTSIANDGRFKGHANGSIIKCKNFYGFN
ncbi:hypothetical protein V8G54_011169 [Vigna mungo]|uniref:Uncharacterized protein n=1 Tax=Vigna mungo TaxID=3915 RepID=A0AAQ3NQX8_VIGMU